MRRAGVVGAGGWGPGLVLRAVVDRPEADEQGRRHGEQTEALWAKRRA